MSCPPTCTIYEVIDIVPHKLSWGIPQAYNAFVFMSVLNGFRQRHEEHVVGVSKSLPDNVYFAAGHLFGNGPHNSLVEILTDDLEQLLRTILSVSDVEGVVDVRVMRLDRRDQRGMGG